MQMACPATVLAPDSVRRGNIFGWMSGSLTEEKLLHLLHDDFLILLARRIQAIFVEQHLAVFHPLAPRLLRDAVVNLFSQVAVERRLGKSRQFLFQFCAEDFVIGHRILLKLSHRYDVFTGFRRDPSAGDGEMLCEFARASRARASPKSPGAAIFSLTNYIQMAISCGRTAAHTRT